MHILAYVSLLLALLCSLGCGGIALIQLWQRRSDHLAIVSKGQWPLFFFLFLASALLLHALFWEDYRLEYVFTHTDSFLPVFYRLTAFWAGQSGSMLFWALMTALAGLLFSLSSSGKKMGPDSTLWFWVFYYAIMAFFCLILTCWSNPFTILQPAPRDGSGLNPLLQNPGMIFHPPLLFMGYAFFTVPACLGLANLLAGSSFQRRWHRLGRRYIIFSWLLLTAGIILGAWWAYMELGWGGYWAWDPVENASLIPWLVATAGLHTIAVENHGGKLDRISCLLMALTVITAIFGTYLTRSGIIQSVHAFGDGGVGTPLLIFVICATLVSITAAICSPSRSAPLASPVSREGILILTSWLFLALALIILVATIWPVLGNFFSDAPRGLDASFYNRVCLPLGVILLAILSICACVGWTGGFASNAGIARFIAICGAFAATVGAIWLAGFRQPLALCGAGAAIAAACAMIMRVFSKSTWKHKAAFSAVGAHMGMALLALGVSFSGPYTTEGELLLSRGQHGAVGPYAITLEDVKDGSAPGYDYLKARLKVSYGSEDVGILTPERRIYAKFGSMQFSEVDVISNIAEDIYASLYGMDEDYKVLVKISIEPLVNWIWIGGAIMVLFPLLSLFFVSRKESSTPV